MEGNCCKTQIQTPETFNWRHRGLIFGGKWLPAQTWGRSAFNVFPRKEEDKTNHSRCVTTKNTLCFCWKSSSTWKPKPLETKLLTKNHTGLLLVLHVRGEEIIILWASASFFVHHQEPNLREKITYRLRSCMFASWPPQQEIRTLPRDMLLSLFTGRQIVKSGDSFAAELLSGEANGGSSQHQPWTQDSASHRLKPRRSTATEWKCSSLFVMFVFQDDYWFTGSDQVWHENAAAS